MFAGVTVNSVHPGSVDTNLFSPLPQPAKFIVNLISKLFFRVSLLFVFVIVLNEVRLIAAGRI
jgi:NAD(P)-dependent dehydrogenase (short-subunit alcohol dehydrogenase family)